MFGSNPAPAPSMFGATPAPSGGFGAASSSGFGSTAPAPSGSFGSSSATSTGFGSTPTPGGFFGQPAAAPSPFSTQPAPQATAPGMNISPKTHYKDLPDQVRTQVDRIAKVIMEKRRTMAQAQSMGPASLNPQVDQHGEKHVPLQKKIQDTKKEMETNLMPKINELVEQVNALRNELRQTMATTITHAKWPAEFLANSRGIRITKAEEKKDETIDAELRILLERQASYVNRVERLPSPFFWAALEDCQNRLQQLMDLQDKIKARTEQEDWTGLPVSYLLSQQDEQLFIIRRKLQSLHLKMDLIRAQYARMETRGPNVLEEARLKEAARERQIAQDYRRISLLMAPQGPVPGTIGTPAPAGSGLFSFQSPAPSSTSLLGASTPAPAFGPAPAPSGGFFGIGSTSTTPTQAPGGFGSTPSPAPGGFGLLGSTAAPTPSGNLFGGGAPAPAGSFGFSPAPSTTQSSRKKNSRANRRSK